MELQGRLQALRRSGLGLAAISYDPPQVLADFSKRNRITFALLSDPGSATIRRYGILNTVIEEALGPNGKDPAVLADLEKYVTVTQAAERFRGIPFPGTFIVDRQGRVTSRFFENYYWERNTVSSIMLRLGTVGTRVEGTSVSTEHLDLKAYPSDPRIAPGTRFSLVLDITPKRGMHVYAPGASSYRIITLNVTPQAHVRTTPLRYPRSDIYNFVPLNERVAVFQKPFTLTADVIVEATAAARKALTGRTTLAIDATLEYQACDDKICYNPVSLPLSFTVALEGLVPGAPPQAPPPQ